MEKPGEPGSVRFPRSARYHPDWVRASMGSASNALWLTEWLAEVMEFRPGMRVLDLACGRAASSVFLHREFGVQVWGVDLWFDPSENLERIRDAGVEAGVFPIRADARALPFAAGFFDALVCVDAWMYFGSDDHVLGRLARFVKPDGRIGIATSALTHEIDGAVPDHLREWFTTDQLWCLHSADWWRRQWERTGFVDVEHVDTLPDGWRLWLESLREVAPDNKTEIEALESDAGRHLGYARVVGRRRPGVEIEAPVTFIPFQYTRYPLLVSPAHSHSTPMTS